MSDGNAKKEAMTDEVLLKEINKDIPNLDWKFGARAYISHYINSYGPEAVQNLSFSKPLMPITPEDPSGSLLSVVSYLSNFTNSVKLLSLPRGARILDVGCGGGWVSHWLGRIGYNAHGIDISEEFIELAKRRVARDPDMSRDAGAVSFSVLDIEETSLPSSYESYFDAVIIESCLHHFVNPIAAMRNVVKSLKEDGVVLIIEGENRTGPIHASYMDVMLETQTLERPYYRQHLIEILNRVGLPDVSFLTAIEGYVPEHDPRRSYLAAYADEVLNGRNTCICARNANAMKRVVPSYPERLAQSSSKTMSDAPLPIASFKARMKRKLHSWIENI